MYKVICSIVLTAALVTMATVSSCTKEKPLPPNPYDNIDRGDTTGTSIPVDSLTITYVHQKVLQNRCALPGCHVGNFEPDYRTPQSSFSTMVYAPVLKNNAANSFAFRVIPYDKAKSVLYERITNCCFVNNNDRMPQDNIGTPLPDNELQIIERWIMNGARDMYGNVPQRPNNKPVIQGYLAASTDLSVTYSNNRLDSVFYNPFIVPASVGQFYVGIAVSDDKTPISQLTVNKLKISTHPDNFNGAYEVTATFINLPTYQGFLATVNTATLPANDTLFMRYYAGDGESPQPSEFPRNESPTPYKTYWSFIRQ